MSLDFKKTLFTWKESYPNGWLPRTETARKEAFVQLFTDIESQGLTKDEVENLVESKRREVVAVCFNENSKKSAIWKKMVESNLDSALAMYNPSRQGTVTESTIQKREAVEPVRIELNRDDLVSLAEPQVIINDDFSDILLDVLDE